MVRQTAVFPKIVSQVAVRTGLKFAEECCTQPATSANSATCDLKSDSKPFFHPKTPSFHLVVSMTK